MAEIDYRDLLKRYMNEVMDWEGVSFIPKRKSQDFSSAEIAELQMIEDEVCTEFQAKQAQKK